MFEEREGEERLAVDPATMAGDAHLVFIGHVVSPWKTRQECPKNMEAARAAGRAASIVIKPAYRAGLKDLERASHVIVLTYFDRAPRDLIMQKPKHVDTPRGTFSLRSPVRPNPVGLHAMRLLGLDHETGTLRLEAIDVLDGTPVIDIKPYYASNDVIADAVVRKDSD